MGKRARTPVHRNKTKVSPYELYLQERDIGRAAKAFPISYTKFCLCDVTSKSTGSRQDYCQVSYFIKAILVSELWKEGHPLKDAKKVQSQNVLFIARSCKYSIKYKI